MRKVPDGIYAKRIFGQVFDFLTKWNLADQLCLPIGLFSDVETVHSDYRCTLCFQGIR